MLIEANNTIGPTGHQTTTLGFLETTNGTLFQQVPIASGGGVKVTLFSSYYTVPDADGHVWSNLAAQASAEASVQQAQIAATVSVNILSAPADPT